MGRVVLDILWLERYQAKLDELDPEVGRELFG
jgi:hypothetical protein